MNDDVKAVAQKILDRTKGQIGTHSMDCYMYHLPCFASYVMHRLEAVQQAPAVVDREALIERVDGSALDHFLRSFNGDEAGDIDYVGAQDGNTGWAMVGGNDVAAVLLKAFDALIASGGFRPEHVVKAEALEEAADMLPQLAGWQAAEAETIALAQKRLQLCAQQLRGSRS